MSSRRSCVFPVSSTPSRLLLFLLLLALCLPAPSRAQLEEAPPALPESFPQYRTIDGTYNNWYNPDWGSTDVQLLRLVPEAYDDGIDDLSGPTRPGARAISNAVVAQPPTIIASFAGPTNMVWVWGQFIDHDLDLTESQMVEAHPAPICLEPAPIPVPLGDPFFDPHGTGTQVIDLCRSIFDPATGTDPGNPRQQINQITAYLDGSAVYGSDTLRATTLRTGHGGFLKETWDPIHGALLPYNVYGLPNAGGADNPSLFLAGDVRANENVALTAMHTLWMREHNHWAARFGAAYPWLGDEQIYQLARAVVGAEIQSITYYEFLPILIGKLDTRASYDPWVNAGISNIFSTAAYRFGHTMLTDVLARLQGDLTTVPDGRLELKDAFFAPALLTDPDSGGIEPLLRGAARQRANKVDPFIVDAVRNFLFGPPGAGGFDLASLNIQRGRDHGHPGYNDVRIAFGLKALTTFDEITSNASLAEKLKVTYGNVNDIDPWVGGLAEDPVPGGLLGETFRAILTDQFTRLRQGDRFWFENYFDERWVKYLRNQRLGTVIRRNTTIAGEIQKNVFQVP